MLNPPLVYDEASHKWKLVYSGSKRPQLCAVLRCRNDKPRYGRVCSRCLMRRWRANNPHISSFAQLKTNANKRGIPFQLSLAEFRTFCDATGYIDKRGRFVGNFHVDRIDSLRGYEASNIQLLSATENCGVKATREKYALQRLRQQGIDCELTRRYAELDEQQQPYNEFLDYELENIDAPF